MKDSELKQGSTAWHQFRSLGIGSSDAAAIMNESPWKTAFELWTEKTGLLKPSEPNVYQAIAMKKGTDNEPAARALYIERTGTHVEPQTFVHPEHSFLRASLDGWNEEKRHIIEIKVPGKVDLAAARKGKVPSKYKIQMAHQFMTCDAATMDYVVYNPDQQELIIIPVERDREYEKQLLEAEAAFWQLVQTATPPPVKFSDLDKVVQRVAAEMEKVQKTLHVLTVVADVMRGQADD